MRSLAFQTPNRSRNGDVTVINVLLSDLLTVVFSVEAGLMYGEWTSLGDRTAALRVSLLRLTWLGVSPFPAGSEAAELPSEQAVRPWY